MARCAWCVCAGTHLKSDPGCERSPVISEASEAAQGEGRGGGGVSESVSFRGVGGSEGWGGVKSSEYEESAGAASHRCWMKEQEAPQRVRRLEEFSPLTRVSARAALKR